MKKHVCSVNFKKGTTFAHCAIDDIDYLKDPYYLIMAQVMREAEKLVCRYSYLLPDGWRVIVDLDTPDDIICHLDLQGNKGGGNYAQAKMSMLSDAERFASGNDTIAAVINELKTLVVDKKEEPKIQQLIEQLSTLESVCQIPDDIAEVLNQDYLIAPYYGAVKIPYETLTANSTTQEEPDRGEIRIAFSGASEEQDVMFALSIFKILQRHLVEKQALLQHWFNLRPLVEIPKVHFWIDQLSIQEAL